MINDRSSKFLSKTHLSVNKHVRVPDGDVKYITISPRRCVVNVILACTCSKKLTPLQ